MSGEQEQRALHRTGRGFALLGFGEIVARLASFAVVAFVSKTVGVSSFGIIAFATAIMLYAQRLVLWEFDALGLPEVARDDREARRAMNGIFAFRAVVALLLLLVALVCGRWLADAEHTVFLTYAAGLSCVALNTRFVHLMRHQPGVAATARVVAEFVNAGLVLLLVSGAGDVTRVPWGFVAGEGVASLFMLHRAGTWPGRDGAAWAYARSRARRALPLVMSAMLGLVVFNLDLIMLRVLWGTESAGYYGVAFSVVSIVLNLGMAYNANVLPSLTLLRGTPEAMQGFYSSALLLLAVILAPLVVGGMVLAPHLVDQFFGARYQPASIPLVILLASSGLAAARFVPTSALVALDRRRTVLHVNLAGAALNVTLNVLLIPRHGMLGAAISTLATDAVRTLLTFVLTLRAGMRAGHPSRYVRTIVALGGMAVVAALLRGGPIWISIPVAGLVYMTSVWGLGVARFSRVNGLQLGGQPQG